MLHPLISLWRHNIRVTFYEAGGSEGLVLFGPTASPFQSAVAGVRHSFRSSEQAKSYLRFWLGDTAARMELAWLLKKTNTGAFAARPKADDWIDALANRLFSNDIVVMEEAARMSSPGQLVVSSTSAANAASALAAMEPLSSVPAAAVPEAILPALEDVRIEGAEVMPEIDQTLDQVALARENIGATTASLAPTTSSIADIQASINSASADAAALLGSV